MDRKVIVNIGLKAKATTFGIIPCNILELMLIKKSNMEEN